MNYNKFQSVYIRGQVYSKKNSKVYGKNGKLFSSKGVRDYEKNKKEVYVLNRKKFKSMISAHPYPIYVGLFFIRETDRAFDYNNISQLVLDMIVKHSWVEDDNMRVLVPVFLGYVKNKEKAGVIIMPLRDYLEAHEAQNDLQENWESYL
jgi:Holliday junction resolvase RusA-like endonuclease